jgi:hypothetical protein
VSHLLSLFDHCHAKVAAHEPLLQKREGELDCFELVHTGCGGDLCVFPCGDEHKARVSVRET